jgi:hypothetical protein
MSSLLRLFRSPAPSPPTYTVPFTALNNPYPANRPWPPDFNNLSSQHRFRLERRYRRRTKLKWARPNWKKGVTLAQWGSILFVIGYGVLYLEFEQSGGGEQAGERAGRRVTVMDGVREWLGLDELRRERGPEGTQKG